MNIRKNFFNCLLLVIAFLFASNVNAQYVLTPSKTLTKYQNFNELTYDSIHIANTSPDTLYMQWQLIQYDTTGGSYLDFCSSGNCWLWVPATGSFPPIAPGKFGWAGVHYWTGNVTATCTTKIWLYKQGSFANGDTITYILHAVNNNSVDENVEVDNLFEVYPNPASDKITIKIANNSFLQKKISLYNIIGEVVYTSILKNTYTDIPLNELGEGMYFLNILSENKTYTKKIVVRK